MKMSYSPLRPLLGILALTTAAFAYGADPVRIGLVYTLSGPLAVLGQQSRDGFQLAVKELGGKLGGRDVEIVVADDELKPDVALSKVRGLLERDRVDFVVGPISSSILQVIFKPVVSAGVFLISTNSGPSTYAGKDCNANFFVTSYQNDQIFEAVGKFAQDQGYKRVFVLVPNYQAGKDAISGFRRYYKGTVTEEAFVPLNNLDFQSELAKIAADRPDALFTFMPGGMGVNLVKQFQQAGLTGKVPFLSAFTVDEATLPAQREAALGMLGGMTWAPDTNTPQNRKFVAGYEAAYGSVPGSYAFQAYDAALLIDSAIRQVKGDLSKKDAVRAALQKADFQSVRGNFKFGQNGYPVQSFYMVRAAKRPDGKFQTEVAKKVFDEHVDQYAKDCRR
jgi:branched-chain amino acid transport system substrate-binding protein